VDPVSRVLAHRERNRRSLLPWMFLALGLHLALLGGIYLLQQRSPRLIAAQLPTVSVRLIHQVRKSPAARARRKPVSARPEPRPTAVPKPHPKEEPKPEHILKSRNDPKRVSPASSQSMPLPGAHPTPASMPAENTPNSSGIARGGLSLDSGESSGGIEGVPSDFQFTYYLERMLALIESRWYQPPVPSGTSARARFTIEMSGKLRNPGFDRAVLRALYAANPLPPLPPAYRKSTLTIHLDFKKQ